MAKPVVVRPKRRQFTEEFRREAVQMMLDGLSGPAAFEGLGLSDPTILYVWKKKLVAQSGPVAGTLEGGLTALFWKPTGRHDLSTQHKASEQTKLLMRLR